MERRTFIKGIAAGSGLLMASAATLTSIVQADDDDDDIIHHLEHPDNPSMLEKKHVPAVEAPSTVARGDWFTVKVRVGYLVEHPSTSGHWIKEITLMLDRQELAEMEFKIGGLTASSAEFTIRLEHDAILTARAECNLHGEWESAPVTVKVS